MTVGVILTLGQVPSVEASSIASSRDKTASMTYESNVLQLSFKLVKCKTVPYFIDFY